MKKKTCIASMLVLFGLSACIPPIGFFPELKIDINANVEGEISVVTPDSMLLIHNHTETLDITKVSIRDPNINGIVAQISGKPKAGFQKVFNLRPITGEYEITLEYREANPNLSNPPLNSTTRPGWDWGNSPNTNPRVFEIALPVKGLYHLHFFRKADGSAAFAEDLKVYEAERNSEDDKISRPDPDDSPEEGNTGGGLTEKNKNRLGLLIFKNLTTLDVDAAKFNFYQNVGGQDQAMKSFSMIPGPRHHDQRSILLGPHDWKTQLTYKVGGVEQTTAEKVVTVNAGETFYAYFYKTKNGDYSVSTAWPPVPNNAADNNEDPADISSNQGWLEIINNSAKGSIITNTKWQGKDYETHVMPGGTINKERFVLPVGKGTLQFRINGKSEYGAPFTREIKPRQTTTVAYVDGFENDDYVPPGMGLIKIENEAVNTRVISVNIVDPVSSGGSITIHNTDFILPGPIGYAGKAKLYVQGTQGFPLRPGKQYLIQANVAATRGSDNIDLSVERYEVVYGRIITITIKPLEIQANTNHGSTISIHNDSDYHVLSVHIANPRDLTESATITSSGFSTGKSIQKGESASFRVVSSPSLPIVSGRLYKIRITLVKPGASSVSYVTLSRDNLRLYDVDHDIWITQTEVNDNSVNTGGGGNNPGGGGSNPGGGGSNPGGGGSSPGGGGGSSPGGGGGSSPGGGGSKDKGAYIRLLREDTFGTPIQSVTIFKTGYSRGSVDASIGKSDLSYTGSGAQQTNAQIVAGRKNPFPVPPQESVLHETITSGLPVTKGSYYDLQLPVGRYLIFFEDHKGYHGGYTQTTWFLLDVLAKLEKNNSKSNPIVIKTNSMTGIMRY